MGCLNYRGRIPALYQIGTRSYVQLNEDLDATLKATTTDHVLYGATVNWSMLSKHSFQSTYIYPGLIESLLVGNGRVYAGQPFANDRTLVMDLHPRTPNIHR